MTFHRTKKSSLFPFLLAALLALPMKGVPQNEEGERKSEKSSKKENAPRPSSDLEVNKGEIKKLVKIDKPLRGIQIRTQKKLRKNIENSGIGSQRYGEIRRAQQSGDNPDMTKEEKEQMKELKKKNERTRKAMMAKMKKKVKAKGMSFDRYKKLRNAVSRRPELRSRYRKHMKAQQKKRKAPKKEQSPKK